MSLHHARNFGELIVYQKAKEVSRLVFRVTKAFPKEETYSLTDQVRRSSRSVGAQIAEAWGKRRYEKHFISKLTDADGEQMETQHWISEALDCGYLPQEDARNLADRLLEIGRMLNGMIAKSDQFCGDSSSTLREDSTEYFVE